MSHFCGLATSYIQCLFKMKIFCDHLPGVLVGWIRNKETMTENWNIYVRIAAISGQFLNWKNAKFGNIIYIFYKEFTLLSFLL